MAEAVGLVRPEAGASDWWTKGPSLLRDLDALVDAIIGDGPQSPPLRWTCKSTPRLAKERHGNGHTVSQRTLCGLLGQLGSSLQATRKIHKGGLHGDREAQFACIASMVAQYQQAGEPGISVDTKNLEWVGDFKNAGQEWQPEGLAGGVWVYEVIDSTLDKVAPYCVHDISANPGWVSVSVTHDTAEVAVETLRRWWRVRGNQSIPPHAGC